MTWATALQRSGESYYEGQIMIKPETGEIRFGSEKGGLFITNEDCQMYFAALHTILAGRHDSISLAQLVQLQEMLRSFYSEDFGKFQSLRSFEECLKDSDLAGTK